MMITRFEECHLSSVLEIEKKCFNSPWSKDQIMDVIDDPFNLILLCFEKDRVTGYIAVQIFMDDADVLVVAVDPDYQHRGYGEALLEEAINRCLSENVLRIHLEVRVSNEKAIGLYKKKGFEIIRTRKGYYDNPREDAYDMIREIGGNYA